MWQPSATRELIVRRAELLARIRQFFAQRGVLEVETPVLSAAASAEPHLHALTTQCSIAGSDRMLYLHTSPEFPMKRLLAAGSGPIYQIARVFRDGESGRRHNPEFTMLEWYRPGFDHLRLMDEVAELLDWVTDTPRKTPVRFTYRRAFRELAGVDPFGTLDSLRAYVEGQSIGYTAHGPESSDIDIWRDLILVHRVEPNLDPECPTFLYDYPASQASMSRVRPDDPPVAERFELYWRGLELANGFHELCDPDEQARRFTADESRRATLGLPSAPEDQRLLGALQAGLPACAGVALGVDRLLMAMTGARHIEEVLAFPIDRA